MSKELLSIIDENSILITAEFLESGTILKVGDRDIHRYEIDLIVKNDITCNQLFDAIRSGLRNRLLNKFDQKAIETHNSLVYSESRYPKVEKNTASESIPNTDSDTTDYSVIQNDDSKKTKKNRVIPVFKYKKAAEKVVLESEALECFQQPEPEPPKEDTRTAYEMELHAYLICWSVLQECLSAYFDKPTDKNDNPDSPRGPIICLGSVDYKKYPNGSSFGQSDRTRIKYNPEWGQLTLKDAGFITTSRIIFDPVGWCHSSALIDDVKKENYDIRYETNDITIIDAFIDEAPLYNISERPLRKLDDDPIQIIPPTDPPQKDRQSILTTVLTPLLMTGAIVGTQIITQKTSGTQTGIMMGGMSAISALVAIINHSMRKREYKKSVEKWREEYQLYIRRLLSDIEGKQTEDTKKLHELYPPSRSEDVSSLNSNNLVYKSLTMDGDIFSHGQEHPDFLCVRIGYSTEQSELVPSIFDVIGEKKDAIFASIKYANIKNIPDHPFSIFLPQDNIPDFNSNSRGYLINLPADIAREYSYLKKAPVLLNLKNCQTLGMVLDDMSNFWPFISNMLLNLCFYQSPENLQCIMFCKQTHDWMSRHQTIRLFKHLPHFRELLGDLSPFAFSESDAYLIFNKLLEILAERKKASKDIHYPHILLIFQEEYDLKRHPISEYLPVYNEKPGDNDYGISFIFCKRYTEELPKYCEQIIKKTNENWYLIPHTQMIKRSSDSDLTDGINQNSLIVNDDKRYGFIPDEFPSLSKDIGNQDSNNNYYRAFKSISSLYYKRIAQGAEVPSKVELFDIFGNPQSSSEDEIYAELKREVYNKWGVNIEERRITKTNDITTSLSVPIGLKASDIVHLDLHEKNDGPHMLVAGTTGSGKTETVLTFLINLCATYTPEQVNLLLMDMKGAGFVKRIGEDENKLPHVVGTVTDISGDETATGTAYMLKRFLHSMTAEVKRRKLYLSKMGVDSVDGYTTARADLDKHIRNHKNLNRAEIEKLPPLPHLFLVIDEFTELMKFTNDNGNVDFKTEITSLARIGRSLGFHIILISQNIENAITPDIRVNSRARLCLKVATRDASKEMIGTDIAASALMPGNGRAYLLIGTGSRFEYFQSGYSGADITRNLEAPIVVTMAETSGKYSLFYDSEENNNPCAQAENSTESDLNSGNASLSKYAHSSVKKKTGITQLQALVQQIIACDKQCQNMQLWKEPHCVFQQPLPRACYYNYDWENDRKFSSWKELKTLNTDGKENMIGNT